MQYYLNVYTQLVRANVAVFLAYRWGVLHHVLSTIGWTGFSFVSVYLLTNRTGTVYGWTQTELMLVAFTYSVVNGIVYGLFSRNFYQYANILNYGNLDILLLRPIDAQFLLSTQYINFVSFIRAGVGIGLTFFTVYNVMEIPFSWNHIMLYILFVFCGVLIMYSLWFSVCTIVIWFPKLSNVIDLLYNLTGTSRMPQEVYQFSPYKVLWIFIPLTFAIVVPAKAIMQSITTTDVSLLLITTGSMFLFCRWFWLFALRSYTSASS